VPVEAQAGTVFGIGNNECVASEPTGTAFWAEDRCESLDRERAEIMSTFRFPREHVAVWSDRAYTMSGIAFVRAHPWEYLRLSFRRAWTLLLPFHPRQPPPFRAAIILYWLIVVAGGLLGLAVRRPRRREPLIFSLTLVVIVNLLVLSAIYLSPDLRFRVGADLLLGSFAGWGYARVADGVALRLRSTRPAPTD